jgi:hypothetical protein
MRFANPVEYLTNPAARFTPAQLYILRRFQTSENVWTTDRKISRSALHTLERRGFVIIRERFGMATLTPAGTEQIRVLVEQGTL